MSAATQSDPTAMLTSADVASLCRVSPATVRAWHAAGKLPKACRLGNQYLWRAADVEALIGRPAHEEKPR